MDAFTALAEPTRRNIIELLAARGQLPAGAIYHKFKISPQAVSQHLKILRDTKLVRVEKRAQQRLYQVNPATIHEVEDWAKQITRQWEKRFERLDSVLKELNKKETKHGRKPRK
ncbi:MAG TPA: metalloregulator ArsR/SmtB family transcription factor [Candidatus Saccharimonadales bacterium]